MKIVSFTILSLLFCCVFTASVLIEPQPYDRSTPVSSVLMALGEDAPAHYIGTSNSEKIGFGKDIVITGKAYLPDGTWSERVSPYFNCVDCHNVLPEAPFADDNDPESRLQYSMEFNQPYLPGSTLYGITNRTSWFNGDHIKKYGDLVKPANQDLKNAIQLCSKECSAGRYLEDWEMEGVLHYLNALELKMKDLDLSEEELTQIAATGQTEEQKTQNISLIKSKYIQAYPATFSEVLPVEKRKMGEEGNLEKGKWIYEKSCLVCHGADKKVTEKTIFGNQKDQKNFDWLVKYFKKSNGGSIYWITRHGTASKEKMPQYMPIYSQEKLSDSQLEDLAAYILAESKK